MGNVGCCGSCLGGDRQERYSSPSIDDVLLNLTIGPATLKGLPFRGFREYFCR